ncbi:MAG TPA: hypothetical protein H9672_07160 [Firmicutes bacterium]|nr:hypothetical protein [Bacillota bacterium]
MALAGLIGIYTGWEGNLAGLEDMISEGEWDREAFEEGSEVLLFMPSYRERDYRSVEPGENLLELNLDENLADYYEIDESIQPGDEITIHVEYKVTDDENGPEYLKEDPKLAFYQEEEWSVTVGGIIHYVPENCENPLRELLTSYENNSFAVVASSRFVNQVREIRNRMEREYTAERYREQYGIETDADSVLIRSGNMLGSNTETKFDAFTVICGSGAGDAAVGNIQNLAAFYGLYPAASSETWQTDYQKAADTAVLWLAGGGTVCIAVLLILFHTMRSALDSSRKQFGIFQTLGVRKKEIRRAYGIRGAVDGALALLLVHLAGAAAAGFRAAEIYRTMDPLRFSGQGEMIRRCLMEVFGGDSLTAHVILCAVLMIVFVSAYRIPAGSVLKGSPVDQVRELSE